LPHSLSENSPVTFQFTSGLPGFGLKDGTVYYAHVVDSDTITLRDGTGATVDLNTIDAYGRFIDCNEISVAPKTVKVNVDVSLNGDLQGAEHSLVATGFGLKIGAQLSSTNTGIAMVQIGGVPDSLYFLSNPASVLGQTTQLKNMLSDIAKGTTEVADRIDSKTEAGKGDKPPSWSAAGSVVVELITNNVHTTIGPAARLKANSDLSINATIVESNSTSTKSLVQSMSTQKGAATKQKSFAAAVAVVVGIYNNSAVTTVGNGAMLDSGGIMTVNSDVKLPSLVSSALQTVAELKSFSAKSIYTAFTANPQLGTAAPVLGPLFNSTASTIVMGRAPKTTIAAAVNVVANKATADVFVGDNVEINQDTSYRSPASEVFVTSDVTNFQLYMTGTAENMSIRISSASDLFESFTVNSVIVHYTMRRGLR
jgi:LysM repeat protein